LRGQIRGDLYELDVDDMIFAVYHGTQQESMNKLIQSGKYDVVVCGHTHRTTHTRLGNTIVVNPGTANAHSRFMFSKCQKPANGISLPHFQQ